jgi:MSHA pilin protein MshD
MIQLRNNGFTLLESLIASALLAFVVAAVAQAVAAGQRETSVTLERLRGTALAEALMEEIVSKPYADPQGDTAVGPDSGEVGRAGRDNIDDYDGFSETANNITDSRGDLYPAEYQGFIRAATAQYTTMTVSGLGAAPITGISLAVTVTESPGGASWTLTRFIPAP